MSARGQIEMTNGVNVNIDILQGYERQAPELIARYEKISSKELFRPIKNFLPQKSVTVLDIGAGTGRDAAWFASLSHSVTAVEPVNAFRAAGKKLHETTSIFWIDDRLPDLQNTTAQNKRFDFIVISAVWQHLNNTDRKTAFCALRRLIAKNGILAMSIRHGVGALTRPTYPASLRQNTSWAESCGFTKLYETSADSVQGQNHQSGITWNWLVFQA